ncbi:MAG: hypothetical protein IKU09_06250, partial [Firmicutes bacterium]|nr:hypothetical protein [Bacillota bacterium]
MINISGISESRVAPVAAYLSREEGQSIIIVPSENRAKRLAEDLSFFIRDREIYVLPSEEHVFLKYEARNHDMMMDRLKALKALRTGQPAIVIAPVSAAMKKITPYEAFEEKVIKITLGEDLDVELVKERLVQLGYERMGVVEARGEYSIRGGIIDIYTPDGEYPYRIEL